MGKLSILGAQRVKALQEILDEQKKAELAKVAPKYPSNTEVLASLETEYPGITDAFELVSKVMGSKPSRKYGDSPFDKMCELLTERHADEAREITSKFDAKARELWLCETLEEAKAIVYGTGSTNV